MGGLTMIKGLQMPLNMQDEEQALLVKVAIKQAINEWLDLRFAALGKWTIRGLAAAALAALAHIATGYGWWK
jgi:hypothetical protein